MAGSSLCRIFRANHWPYCHVCLVEMPHLIDFYNESDTRNFEMVAVAMPYDPPNRVVETTDIMDIPFPVAIDIEGHVMNEFTGITVTPTMVMLSPDGEIIYQHSGTVDIELLRRTMSGYL